MWIWYWCKCRSCNVVLVENFCTYFDDIYRDFRFSRMKCVACSCMLLLGWWPYFQPGMVLCIRLLFWVHCWSLAYEEVCVFPCSWSVTLRTSLKTDVVWKFLLGLWDWWLQWEGREFDCWVSLVLGICGPLESCTWRVWAQPWEGLWRLCLALRLVIRCVCLLHLWLHCLLALC